MARANRRHGTLRQAGDAALAGLVGPFRLLVRAVPPPMLPGLARAGARAARLLAARDRRLLAANLEQVLGLPPGSDQARRLERQVFAHGLMCALETIRIAEQPELLRLDGYDELRELVARAERAGCGLLVASAHFGAWELVGMAAARATGGRFSALGKPSRNPAFTAALEGMRRRIGASQVIWLGRFGVLRRIARVLQSGAAVGMLVDQKPERRRGPVVSLLGKPAEFVPGPAMLRKLSGCAVAAVFCARLGPFHYRVLAEEVLPGGHPLVDEAELSQRLASAIERVVRLYPEQWTWNYRRWYFDGSSQPAAAAAVPA